MTSQQRPRTFSRFVVMVLGTDEHHRATRQVVSQHAAESAAFGSVVNVLKQWAASHGAIQPGTKVVISDRNDGGQIFRMEYLGFNEDLLTEG